MRRHDDYPVREVKRFVDAVRDEDYRLSVLLPYSQQLALEQHASVRVERAEGLVHQQHLGVVRERAGYRGALAHPARELVRLRVGELFEADAREVVHRYVAAALRVHARKFGAERDVVGDGAPRQ